MPAPLPGNAKPVRLVTADGDAFYTATAGGGSGGNPSGFPLAYDQVSDLTTSVGLPSIPTTATYAIVIPEGADVRWRADGVAPTAFLGMPEYAGATVTIVGQQAMQAMQFIEQSAGGKLNVSYFL